MRKKVLVGVLLGAMMLSIVGCKGKDGGDVKESDTKKPTKTEVNKDVTKTPDVPGKELYEYIDSVFGYSFMMPKYSYYEGMGTGFVQMNKVKDKFTNSVTEKYVGVNWYTYADEYSGIDINKVNSVYDIHDNMGRAAHELMSSSTFFSTILSWDVAVADKAETINGYEMLPYEGTMEMKGVGQNYTYGIYGYYIYANGLPIIVQGVDCSSAVDGGEYPGELSLMASVREDVDAMVRTFNGDDMGNLQMIRLK